MMAKVNTMIQSLSVCKQAQPLVGFPGDLGLGSLKFQQQKEKVVIVMGATGTGKSRLSIDLATHFPAEIVNSDKIQVYDGLDIVTNKVTPEECRGIPHHLLGVVDPHADFTSTDFCHLTTLAIDSIIEKDRVPIIAGGSNSLIDSLVNNDPYFTKRFECCFIWVDVSLPVLRSFVSERVDRMVEVGMIDEVRKIFDTKADYTKGIRRAIGVPEMHKFLEAERNGVDKETLDNLLEDAIVEIKNNTYKLACKQMKKIQMLRDSRGLELKHIDATEVFMKRGRKEDANKAWEKMVVNPSSMIVDRFLNDKRFSSSMISRSTVVPRTLPVPAMSAASY